jgi:hypothetical protein
MILRGIVSQFARTAGKIARIWATARSGETISDREAFQQFGFASKIPAGAQCLIVRRGGAYYVFASEKPDAVPTGDWDSVQYGAADRYVMIKSDGGIVVRGATVTVDAPAVQLGGATGLNAIIDERIIAKLNSHIHLCAEAGFNSGPALSGPLDTPPLTPAPFNAAAHATAVTKAK